MATFNDQHVLASSEPQTPTELDPIAKARQALAKVRERVEQEREESVSKAIVEMEIRRKRIARNDRREKRRLELEELAAVPLEERQRSRRRPRKSELDGGMLTGDLALAMLAGKRSSQVVLSDDEWMTQGVTPKAARESTPQVKQQHKRLRKDTQTPPYPRVLCGAMSHRPVKRIDCSDPTAQAQVTECRLFGEPVVLVNHHGYTNFADAWTTPAGELHLPTLLADIGDETVPVVEKDYDVTNPIKSCRTVRQFVEKSWLPQNSLWYMHQWQFPLSDGGLKKLCHRCAPLEVLGLDLTQYWLDRCHGDTPFQYLFFGHKGTRTALHRDKGGLAITMAPIVGKKEVVMVHRDDTNLILRGEADVETPNLNRHPMFAFARVWRHVLEPGEILLLPEGTHHQCFNMTPCLSYSRFHVDEVNIPAFLQSYLDGDSPEIDHGEIFWNSASDIIFTLDTVTAAVEAQVNTAGRNDRDDGHTPVPVKTSISVTTARALSALLALRHAIQALNLRDFRTDVHAWTDLVRDIDVCLEDFVVAHGVTKLSDVLLENGESFGSTAPVHFSHLSSSSSSSPMKKKRRDTPSKVDGKCQESAKPTPSSTLLPSSFVMPHKSTLPTDSKSKTPSKKSSPDTADSRSASAKKRAKKFKSKLRVGESVFVNALGRTLEAVVKQVPEHSLDAVLVSYEDFDKDFNELQTLQSLRLPGDEEVVSITQLRPGDKVSVCWGNLRERYRASVMSLYHGPLVQVKYPDPKDEWLQWVKPKQVLVDELT